MLVRTVSEALHLSFRRIQFTPDLMPADITGTEIIQEDPETGRRTLVFQPGPIFAQMILADEINRTPPKTQAALLEAMQEHRVTIGQRDLPAGGAVLRARDAEPDRAGGDLPAARGAAGPVHLPHPGGLSDAGGGARDHAADDERFLRRQARAGADRRGHHRRRRSVVRKVPVPDHVMDYVLDLVRATRPNEAEACDFVKRDDRLGGRAAGLPAI